MDKQKLEEARQLAMSMTSHPVAFGYGDARAAAAVAAERERMVRMLNPTTAQLLLACGEMSAVELRTVRAVLGWIERALRGETT